MYYQSKAELEEHVLQAGEQAVFEANCGEFHEELVQDPRPASLPHELRAERPQAHARGRPPRRDHGRRARRRASKTAKRAALLHDLGKALTHEVEGSHALISAQLRAPVRRVATAVVHAIEAHHYEVQPQTVEAVLADRRRRDLGVAARAPAARASSTTSSGSRRSRRSPAAKPGVDEGLRAAGRPRDPRDRQARGGRRRRGRAALARDRPRDRGSARVPGPDQGDRDPRVARDRVREVAAGARSVPRSAAARVLRAGDARATTSPRSAAR